jgi:hypothetical protein
MNPVSMGSAQDLLPTLTVYAEYKRVSGLGINTAKSTALCINTSDHVQEGLQELGIHTSAHSKHLGIYLGESMHTTVLETLRHSDLKLMKRRIMATTPPTDMLHRAQLINMAFTPILNHILMALPIADATLKELDKEVRDFFWTKQCEGETIHKRRRVARPRIAADLHMGGLNVPTFQTLAEGFRLNLLQRIYKRELFPHKYPASHLPGILAHLLREKGRPTLQTHMACLGPLDWGETAAAISPHNKLLGLAFQAGMHFQRMLEKDNKYWQLAPIKGHTKEGPFRITTMEAQALQARDVVVVGQLFLPEINGQLTHNFNEAQLQQLGLDGNLLIKLHNLHTGIRRTNPNMIDKLVQPASLLHYLAVKDSNLSTEHKRRVKAVISNQIGAAPAYATRERDGVYVPDRITFSQGYGVCKLQGLTSKTKEISFEILNRTVWTNNKAFKSGMADDPGCSLCGDIETMEHLLYDCPHYSQPLWAELSAVLTATVGIIHGSPVARIDLTPREIIFNAPPASVILHLQEDCERRTLLHVIQEVKRDILYRRMNLRPAQAGNMVDRTRIQAHILATLRKLIALLEYQNLRGDVPARKLLKVMHEQTQERVA